MTDLSNIVEVVEVNHRIANVLLAAGYKLLTVDQRTYPGELPGRGGPDAGPNPYVRKELVYAIGRAGNHLPPMAPQVEEAAAALRARRNRDA